MNEYEIDPYSWFGNRELSFTPPHFTITKTPITPVAKAWIFSTLKGRFSIVFLNNTQNDLFDMLDLAGCPAFEFAHEAVAYELKWA
jgi:hypothetical protein